MKMERKKKLSKHFYRTAPISITYKDLVVTPPRNPSLEILHKVAGSCFSGEVTALLGPSGAGKTTLLNALAWRTRKGLYGSIHFNDKPREKTQKKVIGYVTQIDHFFSELTVEETFRYAVRLRRGDLPSLEVQDLVDEVIDLLSLRKAAKTKIGNSFNRGISGGELKRVGIGNELIGNPSLFFMDEPTSGLDSSSAVSILETATTLAQDYGIGVILSIHQPSSLAYAMLDTVVFISEGNIVYQGNGADVMGYLSLIGFKIPVGWNIADYFMELLYDKKASDYLVEKYSEFVRVDPKGRYYISYREHSSSLQLESPEQLLKPLADGGNISDPNTDMSDSAAEERGLSVVVEHTVEDRGVGLSAKERRAESPNSETVYSVVKRPSALTVFWILFVRGIKKDLTDISQTLNLIQSIIIGALVGVVWFQNLSDYSESSLDERFGYLFFAVTFWMFLPAFSALSSFPEERDVIAKERASKLYNVSMYIVAKTCSDFILFIPHPTIWVVVSYFMVGLPADFRLLAGTWIIIILNVFVCHSIGMTVSSITANFRRGAVILAVFLQAVMLTAGFFVPFDKVPSWLRWVRWISTTNYTSSLLTHLHYVGRDFECSTPSQYTVCPIPGAEIQKDMSTGFAPYGDVLFLLLYWCVTKMATYFLLRFGKQLRMQ